MTLPFSFPPWVPWWVPVALLVPALLYGLVFLAMPFSVFGVKARLDVIEARLDEIQGEIRALVLRLPEPERDMENAAGAPRDMTRVGLAPRDAPTRPPIPPAPFQPAPGSPRGMADGRERDPGMRTDREDPPRRFAAADDRPRFGGDADMRRRPPPVPPAPARRSEPRIDWPRGGA